MRNECHCLQNFTESFPPFSQAQCRDNDCICCAAEPTSKCSNDLLVFHQIQSLQPVRPAVRLTEQLHSAHHPVMLPESVQHCIEQDTGVTHCRIGR